MATPRNHPSKYHTADIARLRELMMLKDTLHIKCESPAHARRYRKTFYNLRTSLEADLKDNPDAPWDKALTIESRRFTFQVKGSTLRIAYRT